jgi:hypothetical protein
MEIEILNIAESELSEAASYYETKADGLGERFLSEFEEALVEVIENPLAWTEIGANVRRKLIKHFPYGVLFVPQTQKIIVVAVMPLRKRPRYWIDRLKGM